MFLAIFAIISCVQCITYPEKPKTMLTVIDDAAMDIDAATNHILTDNPVYELFLGEDGFLGRISTEIRKAFLYF